MSSCRPLFSRRHLYSQTEYLPRERPVVIEPIIVKHTLNSQKIELPSWAFGNSGTRFKVFPQDGIPRDPFEKVADAGRYMHSPG